MTDLELELFEEYKSLDILLKDVLSSETGVSAYIGEPPINCLKTYGLCTVRYKPDCF